LTFDRDFGDPDPAPIFALGQSNRSGGVILSAANTVAEPLRRQFPEVAELRPQEARADSGDVVIGLYRTAAEEIDAVCDAITAEVAEGRQPSDIAVLCRESKVFPAVIDGLTDRGTPVDVVGLGGLLELPEVVEVISTLEVLYDPTANPSVVRLLSGPRWRIGPADLAQLGTRAGELAASSHGATRSDTRQEHDQTMATLLREAVAGIDAAETVSLVEALEDPGPGPYSASARRRFAEFAEELRRLRVVLHQPPDVAIARVVSATGLDIELATYGSTTDHLDALLEQARGFTASGGGAGVGAFLSYLALAKRYGSSLAVPAPSGSEGVALLTVHKAKGLQYDTVIVPGLERPPGRDTQRLLQWLKLPLAGRDELVVAPVARVGADANPLYAWVEGLEREKLLHERRRLLYVAATRAERWLHLFGSVQVKDEDDPPTVCQPPANVALGLLWPAVGHEFAARLAAIGPGSGEDSPERTRNAPLRRLPPGWHAADLPRAPQFESQLLPRATAEPGLEFDWATETARHVGTVVHLELQRIARDGLRPGDGDDPQRRRRWHDELAELGVPTALRAGAVERVGNAIVRTLADARGQWLLDAGHRNAATELALTGRLDRDVVRVVIDRSFVDAEGVRWIVDYKTSRHEGAGLDAFLDSEQERYRPQLERYASLMRRRGPERIRLGLYFPLLSAWREWPADG
jgi:ATP-dependent exoDNAse (exonuclease V) beta subunit